MINIVLRIAILAAFVCSAFALRAENEQNCGRLIVYPPTVKDAYTSFFIAEEWVKLNAHLVPKCVEVVPVTLSGFYWLALEVDHTKAFSQRVLRPHQWDFLRRHFNPDIIATLSYNELGGRSYIAPSFWKFSNLDPLVVTGAWAEPRRLQQPLAANAFQQSAVMRELISIAPNSFVISSTVKEPINSRNVQGRYELADTKDKHNQISQMLGYLSFASVTHPSFFREVFDYRVQISGSQTLAYWNRKYTFDDKLTPGLQKNYRMKFGLLAPTIDLQLTASLFEVQGFILGGVGVAPYYVNDSIKSEIVGIRPVLRFGWGARAFFSKYLFAQATYEMLYVQPHFVKNEYMDFHSISLVSGGIGMYIPTWEKQAFRIGKKFL